MRTVYVQGIGETRMGKYPERSMHNMIRDAGSKAIEDACISKSDIQAVFVGNFVGQQLCFQGHLGAMVSEELNLGNIPTVRTEGACASGGLAFHLGWQAIAGGLYNTVLVGGIEKMNHQPTPAITESVASAMDFEKEASFGLTFPADFALMANRYFYEYRNVKKEMGMCAYIAHQNACLNDDAHMQKKDLTMEKILSAADIASPLSIYDCSLVTDGAAFVVLTAAENAASASRKRKVRVAGCGHAGDLLTLNNKRSITSFDATRLAAKKAYQMSGLTPDLIDFAEVHDCFTITQIINIEDLGFAEKGRGGDFVAEGKSALSGCKPINTSGGLKAKGHPIGATGISQIFEVVTQIRGDAGSRQIKKADIGLTHNLGGTAGTCVINIFKGE